MTLSNDDKVWLYKNGYYCMQDLTIAVSDTDIQTMIDWIDRHGSWGHNALKMREKNNPMFTSPTNTGDMPNGQA